MSGPAGPRWISRQIVASAHSPRAGPTESVEHGFSQQHADGALMPLAAPLTGVWDRVSHRST